MDELDNLMKVTRETVGVQLQESMRSWSKGQQELETQRPEMNPAFLTYLSRIASAIRDPLGPIPKIPQDELLNVAQVAIVAPKLVKQTVDLATRRVDILLADQLATEAPPEPEP
jgi:hypothetical protein